MTSALLNVAEKKNNNSHHFSKIVAVAVCLRRPCLGGPLRGWKAPFKASLVLIFVLKFRLLVLVLKDSETPTSDTISHTRAHTP